MWFIWALEVSLPWPSDETDVEYNGSTFNLLPATEDNFASIAVQAEMKDLQQAQSSKCR